MSLCVGNRVCKINNVLAEKSWLLTSVQQGTTTLDVSRLFTDLDDTSMLALLWLLDDFSKPKESPTTEPSADLHKALRACTSRQASCVNDVVSYLGLQEANNMLACYAARQVKDELVAKTIA
jgi:hypothetical protein